MSDYRNEQAIAAEAPEQSVSAGGYRALAVISFVLAAGGLFLGLLVKWTDIFTHWMYTASQGAALSGSLIDYLIEYAKSVYDVGVWTYIKGLFGNPFNVAGLSQFLTAMMTAAAVVIALVTLVVSFCSRKAAKNCAMTSLVCVLLGYGGLFAYAFFTARFLIGGNGFSRMMFDIPTAIVAGVALICLVIAALARRKGMGLLNFVLFLLTALCIYSLCNSRSAMVLLMATDIKEEIFFAISAIALFALLSLNFLASSVRLTAKKAYVFDAVRYGLLLAAAVCTVISYGLLLEWANFKEDLLNTVLLLAAPLAAFLLSIVIAIAQASAARRMEAEEESKAISAAYTQPQPAALPAAAPAAASGVVTEGSQDVARNVTVNVQPKPAEAQTPQNVTVNVTPAMYGQQPMMPFYPMPYYTAPAQQQQPVQAEPAAPVPMPAPQPQAETPMSEFERSMAALAKGIEPEPAPESAAAAATTYQSTPAPVFAQPAPAPAPAPAYDASQYTYDSFINSLTPQEKNEFGDLFIANKYGDLAYLPGYVIGGDNREFFSKVFIYFGRFRGHISSALLDKLYSYVCRN